MFADFPRPTVDITGDNVVDFEELAVIAQSWLLDSESPDFDPNADLDGSGAIDFVDFAILADYWRVEGEPGGWYFYHYDGLGSVVALSDNSGTVVEKYSYDAFGSVEIRDANNSVLSVSSVANRFMFTGREYDPETGNYYYRARFYSPTLGRFLSPDPLGYADSMNLYQYCGNNPVMFVDPMGLCDEEKYKQLQEYISSAEAAMMSNIETLKVLHGEQKFWGKYYDIVQYTDAAMTVTSAVKASFQIARGVGSLQAARVIFADKPLWKPGLDYAKVLAGESAIIKGLDDLLGNAVVSATTSTALFSINPARRNKISKYDPTIEQILNNIEVLGRGVSMAREQIQKMGYGD